MEERTINIEEFEGVLRQEGTRVELEDMDKEHSDEECNRRRVRVLVERDDFIVGTILRFDIFAGDSGFDIEPAMMRPLDLDMSDAFTPCEYILDHDFENDKDSYTDLVRDFVSDKNVHDLILSKTGTLEKFI